MSLEEIDLSIVDVQIVSQFGEDPNGMFGYLIFASRAEMRRARKPGATRTIEAKVRAALACAGFPSEAIPIFQVKTTSLPEIDAGGGRFNFFR
jgi:hypothetical protein